MWWTLAAASVASLTALIIAFGAYPWQKNLDRRLQLELEKRNAYREFFSSMVTLLENAHDGSNDEYVDAMLENRKCFNALIFYAPYEVALQCRETVGKLIEYRDPEQDLDIGPNKRDHAKFNAILKLETKALYLARTDIMGSQEFADQTAKLVYFSPEESQ